MPRVLTAYGRGPTAPGSNLGSTRWAAKDMARSNLASAPFPEAHHRGGLLRRHLRGDFVAKSSLAATVPSGQQRPFQPSADTLVCLARNRHSSLWLAGNVNGHAEGRNPP